MFQIADEYINYLKNNNIKFDNNGFPILSKDIFLDEEPDRIVPYYNRNHWLVENKEKTALCFFVPDKDLFPRFKKIFDEIEIYKEYLGVVTPDITVTSDMDTEYQEFIILLNQLFAAVLAVNGVKLLLNTRVGANTNLHLLNHYPKNILCVSSFLGCKKSSIYDYGYLIKIMRFLPAKLLLYGKRDINIECMLNKMGIEYRYYIDFHVASKIRR